MNNNRLHNEIQHGKKLAEGGAESIWNWSSVTGKIRADRRVNFFVHLGRIGPNDSVLEIGCGTGLFTRKVQSISKAKITAVDISRELIDIARKIFPSGNFILSNALDLPFAENTFDVCFGSSVLHHLDFEPALRECYRVLRRGGRLVFAEPNMLNPHIFLLKNIPFLKKKLGDSPDETAIIRWKIAKMMREIGFRNIKVVPHDFLYPATPSSMISLVNKIGLFFEKIPLLREIAGSLIIYGEK